MESQVSVRHGWQLDKIVKLMLVIWLAFRLLQPLCLLGLSNQVTNHIQSLLVINSEIIWFFTFFVYLCLDN